MNKKHINKRRKRMGVSNNIIAKFNCDEVMVCKEGKQITMTYEQALDLRNLIDKTMLIHHDCEAYCGEIVGMPE